MITVTFHIGEMRIAITFKSERARGSKMKAIAFAMMHAGIMKINLVDLPIDDIFVEGL